MWNGTHTEACSLNGYESVICLIIIACPGFYFGFSVLWLLDYTRSYPAFYLCSIPPVSCSYLIILWVFPAWYHMMYIYLPLHACATTRFFNACLWFRFIGTRVLIYARHLAFDHHSPGSSDSSGSSCPGLGACGFSQLLIRVAQR